MSSGHNVMEATKGGPVVVPPHGEHYSAVGCSQGVKAISYKYLLYLLYFAIAIYQHLFLDQYLYSRNIYD